MSRNKARTYKYKTICVDKNRKRNDARYNEKQSRSIISRISKLMSNLGMYDDVCVKPQLNVSLSGYCIAKLGRPKKLKQGTKWIVKYMDRDGYMVEDSPLVNLMTINKRVKFLLRCGYVCVTVSKYVQQCDKDVSFFKSDIYKEFMSFLNKHATNINDGALVQYNGLHYLIDGEGGMLSETVPISEELYIKIVKYVVNDWIPNCIVD